MKKQFKIFISSVQDEFATERKLLKKWLTTDPFVSRFVEKVFLFEDVPSRGKSPAEVFLDEVRASDIYIGLLGSQYYGKRSVQRGVSATEREYAEAVKCGCERFVYLKACDARDKKEQDFVRRVNREVTRTLFNDFNDLKTAVYSSLVEFLDARELIEVGDFDKSACAAMTDADIDTGIKRMVNACKKNKNPIPEFRQDGSMFVATLKKRMVAKRKTTTLKTKLKTTQLTTHTTTQQTTQQARQEAFLIDVLGSILKGKTFRVALYVLQNSKAKIDDIMREIELTRDGVNYHIRILKKTVGLKRNGPKFDSVWKFVLPKRLLRRVTKRRRESNERL